MRVTGDEGRKLKEVSGAALKEGSGQMKRLPFQVTIET
jgi:hypothetical protein